MTIQPFPVFEPQPEPEPVEAPNRLTERAGSREERRMSTPSWPFDRVAPSQCPRSPHRGPMRGFGRRARGLR